MSKISEFWSIAVDRWKEHMPRFFRVMMKVFACIGGSVISIHIGFNELGITPDEWWTEIEPLILGISIGGCFACKFTAEKGNVSIPHITDYDKEQHLEN